MLLFTQKNKRLAWIMSTLCSALLVTNSAMADSTITPVAGQDGWVNLFNGKNLEGWVAKFNGHKLGENYLNTFQVKDGKLIASYANYKTFDNSFGHLFYSKHKYSHYTLRAEYRFVGEQVEGGPEWAYRNNGLMLHSQDPATMKLIQPFPISMETQLLGGNGTDPRPTGNLCSVGTNIVLDGKLETQHCIESNSPTYAGDQWVTIEVEVHGSEHIIHRVNGKMVFEYTDAQYDPRESDSQDLIDKTGSIYLGEGYIAIQAESHPTEFRSIMIKVNKD